jgi:hypothetical protein
LRPHRYVATTTSCISEANKSLKIKAPHYKLIANRLDWRSDIVRNRYVNGGDNRLFKYFSLIAETCIHGAAQHVSWVSWPCRGSGGDVAARTKLAIQYAGVSVAQGFFFRAGGKLRPQVSVGFPRLFHMPPAEGRLVSKPEVRRNHVEVASRRRHLLQMRSQAIFCCGSQKTEREVSCGVSRLVPSPGREGSCGSRPQVVAVRPGARGASCLLWRLLLRSSAPAPSLAPQRATQRTENRHVVVGGVVSIQLGEGMG